MRRSNMSIGLILFVIFGVTVLGRFAAAQYYGWSSDSTRLVKKVPPQMRNNPRVYRAHYLYGK